MSRQNSQTVLLDETLNNAAGEALGINSAADSAAYQRELAAGPAVQALDRDLRETTAMLSAASPYMEPSADLRGKVLQATAPATFRMEDYRKANRETGRFYRWGFYAAMLCLMAGAAYNLNMRSQFNARQQALVQQMDLQRRAISDVVNPKAVSVALEQDKKVVGRAFINPEDKTGVLLLPEGILPPGKTVQQLTLTNQEGKPVTYRTVTIPTSREAFPQVAADDKLNADLNAQNVQPDPSQHVFTAQMVH